MDFAMDGQLVSAEIVLPFPTLREACIKRIIQDTEKIVEGFEFSELASPKYSFILGPFSYLGKIRVRYNSNNVVCIIRKGTIITLCL